MKILLRVIDEDGRIVTEIGTLSFFDLEKIVLAAEKRVLLNLSLIDFEQDTYFNRNQLADIQKEIEILSNDLPEQSIAFDFIKKGIEEVQKDVFIYLKFELNHE